MSEHLRRNVVSVRAERCAGGQGRIHAVAVRYEGCRDELPAWAAIQLLDAGADLYMIPPPGAPAYEAHMATGLPLILQHRKCDGCGQEVLFA